MRALLLTLLVAASALGAAGTALAHTEIGVDFNLDGDCDDEGEGIGEIPVTIPTHPTEEFCVPWDLVPPL